MPVTGPTTKLSREPRRVDVGEVPLQVAVGGVARLRIPAVKCCVDETATHLEGVREEEGGDVVGRDFTRGLQGPQDRARVRRPTEGGGRQHQTVNGEAIQQHIGNLPRLWS